MKKANTIPSRPNTAIPFGLTSMQFQYGKKNKVAYLVKIYYEKYQSKFMLRIG